MDPCERALKKKGPPSQGSSFPFLFGVPVSPRKGQGPRTPRVIRIPKNRCRFKGLFINKKQSTSKPYPFVVKDFYRGFLSCFKDLFNTGFLSFVEGFLPLPAL